MYKFFMGMLMVIAIAYFIFLIMGLLMPEDKEDINLTRALMEYAYFEGQRDALNGDIKIEMSNIDSTWSWIKSPWDGNSEIEVSYNPTEYYEFRPISIEETLKMLSK